MIAFAPLRKLVASPARDAAEDSCDLCTAPIAETHAHVVEIGVRGMLCACPACAILFRNASRDARYRTVPDRVLVDRVGALSLDRLGMPIALAFVYVDSVRDQVAACYPGPAGIIDGELASDAWQVLVTTTRLATMLEPDVEALLLRSDRGADHTACYLIPISAAYELTARLRGSWEGFSGGESARRELARFFAELDARGATP